MATMTELIALAQTKLEVVLNADPSDYVDYRIGDKSVNKSQYVQHLLSIIEKLSLTCDADFDFASMGLDVSQIGEDLAEYET